MIMKMRRLFISLLIMLCLSAGGCTTVKEYQKMHLNDSEMELAARKTQKFETSFQLYREGASGANGGKNGGGCGCN
jgi:cell division protein FtsL